MKPVRIVARGDSDRYRSWSRYDLRWTYRRLRLLGLTAWQARSIITSIVLSGAVGKRVNQ